MGATFSSGPLETATFELQDGRTFAVQYRAGAGLGFVPWPGTFALASYLDRNKEVLDLRNKAALELGSGSCSVAGFAAGLLCLEAQLTDRLEVVPTLGAAAEAAGMPKSVMVKVLDWHDIEFTQAYFRRGQADFILMTDVIYFPHLWQPLVHTLLHLCGEDTVVLWANCDRYPRLVPDLAGFQALLERFFHISIEEQGSQEACGGPSLVAGGSVVVRSLRLIDLAIAEDELARAARSCARRCIP